MRERAASVALRTATRGGLKRVDAHFRLQQDGLWFAPNLSNEELAMKQITIAALACMSIVGCAGREDWTPKNLSRVKAAPAATATSTTTTTSAPVEAKVQPSAATERIPEAPRPPVKSRKANVRR